MFLQTHVPLLYLFVNATVSNSNDSDRGSRGAAADVNPVPAPTLQTLDYAEIALLVVLLAVGGPLNLYSLYRTVRGSVVANRRPSNNIGLGVCYQQNGDSSATANNGKRSVFEILHNVSRRTSALLQGGAISKAGGAKGVSRLLTLKLHLTIANSMIIWLYALSQICWLSTYQFLGHDLACRFVMFMHAFCFYATSNLVALIAIDRLYVALHINRPFSESNVARYNLPGFIGASWILAFVCSTPQLFLWRVYEPYPSRWPGWTQCVSIWTARRYDITNRQRSPEENELEEAEVALQEKIYNILHLALVFWIPALIIVFSYALIMIRFHLNIRKNRACSSSTVSKSSAGAKRSYRPRIEVMSSSETYSESPVPTRPPLADRADRRARSKPELMKLADAAARRIPRTPASTVAVFVNPMQQFVCGPVVVENNAVITLRRAKRRTAKKSFWILFSYVVCWSPYNILALWRFIGPPFEWEFLEFMYNLIVLNAVVNPLIYGL